MLTGFKPKPSTYKNPSFSRPDKTMFVVVCSCLPQQKGAGYRMPRFHDHKTPGKVSLSDIALFLFLAFLISLLVLVIAG
jgi:hypothetical protein